MRKISILLLAASSLIVSCKKDPERYSFSKEDSGFKASVVVADGKAVFHVTRAPSSSKSGIGSNLKVTLKGGPFFADQMGEAERKARQIIETLMQKQSLFTIPGDGELQLTLGPKMPRIPGIKAEDDEEDSESGGGSGGGGSGAGVPGLPGIGNGPSFNFPVDDTKPLFGDLSKNNGQLCGPASVYSDAFHLSQAGSVSDRPEGCVGTETDCTKHTKMGDGSTVITVWGETEFYNGSKLETLNVGRVKGGQRLYTEQRQTLTTSDGTERVTGEVHSKNREGTYAYTTSPDGTHTEMSQDMWDYGADGKGKGEDTHTEWKLEPMSNGKLVETITTYKDGQQTKKQTNEYDRDGKPLGGTEMPSEPGLPAGAPRICLPAWMLDQLLRWNMMGEAVTDPDPTKMDEDLVPVGTDITPIDPPDSVEAPPLSIEFLKPYVGDWVTDPPRHDPGGE